MEKIEFSSSIHLALDQLELTDLTFGLAIGPTRGERGDHRGFVFRDAVRQCRNEASLGALNPGIEFSRRLLRIIAWKSATTSRASTRGSTPLSIAATVTVSALESWSRPIVINLAMVRAEGARFIDRRRRPSTR